MAKPKPAPQDEHVHGPDCDHEHDQHGLPPVPFRRAEPKLGRNDPCFCGSGRKYKKCHGAAGQSGPA